MNTKRPIYLNLFQFSWPCTAITSVIHRICGFFLFVLFIPAALWALDQSLASQASFNWLHELFSNIFVKIVVWGLLVMLMYHIVAGIRHMLMDVGVGEGRESGRWGAYAVFAVAIILAILVGIWLW